MSDFVDVGYFTQAVGLTPAQMSALMQNVILQKNVLDHLGLRVAADATTLINPITRTIRFAFGPSGPTDAVATIANTIGSIGSIIPGNRGLDYIRPPLVTLSQKVLTPAILQASLQVSANFTIVPPGGVGYATPPRVVFLGGLPPAGRNFHGCVRTIYMLEPGLGYPPGTTVNINGGSLSRTSPVSSAKALPIIDAFGRITGIVLTEMGAEYVTVPDVVFNSHGVQVRKIAKAGVSMAEGTPATAHTTIDGAGHVNAVFRDTPGTGYVGVPDVLLIGGGFALIAQVIARMELERVDVLFAGTGYKLPLSPVFTPYFKTLFPDGSGQDRPFNRIFESQFIAETTSPVQSALPILI